jgi:SAM-dependent methyltransferase
VRDHYLDGPVHPERTELAVEIGSGLGRISAALNEHFDRVVGIDVSPAMVGEARRRVPDPTVDFRVGDGTGLTGIDDATVDLVFSFTVFQHIPDAAIIEGYLAEAGRVLRPGGVFVFQWNNEPGALRWALRRRVLAWLQGSGLRPERYERHAAEFLGSRVPRPRIERALAAAGLRLVATQGDGTLFAWAWAVR